ncbi:MAG: hypothetical protein ACYC1W_03445, partial [Gemmatimonadaceae bacterium]
MRHPIRFALFSVLVVAACGGGSEPAADAAAAGAAVAAVDPATLDPATITPAELALGDSLFHRLICATSCQACHG